MGAVDVHSVAEDVGLAVGNMLPQIHIGVHGLRDGGQAQQAGQHQRKGQYKSKFFHNDSSLPA